MLHPLNNASNIQEADFKYSSVTPLGLKREDYILRDLTMEVDEESEEEEDEEDEDNEEVWPVIN